MKRQSFIYFVALLLMAACGEEKMPMPDTDKTDEDNGSKRLEIRLQAEIDQFNVTRADDSGFADGDCIGVFAVDFTENGNPGTLAATGNHADNVAFTYNASSFACNPKIYFNDATTPVDFYGYYPYIQKITDVGAHPFSVKSDQSKYDGKMSAYEASDFLWGKRAGVTPSAGTVTIILKHILSSVEVTLEQGDGFEAGEWESLEKSVIISNTKLNAEIDLTTGAATVNRDSKSEEIVPVGYKSSYRAIVIPQSVETAADLFDIMVGNESYAFSKEETQEYQPGKLHKFVVKVSKSIPEGALVFSLIDESVTVWENDLISHDGNAKEYIVVNNAVIGELQTAVENLHLEPSEIINLKITGEITEKDIDYIRGNLHNLESLNLYEVRLKNINGYNWEKDSSQPCDDYLPPKAFQDMSSLKHCVLPKKLKIIGADSFNGTSLTGSLVIPEGVTKISRNAFLSTNLTGNLTLPSTLKYIGGSAFKGCLFTGELILPEGLEIIDYSAFANCVYFTGDLRIPDSVENIGDGAFEGMRGITGWLVLPKNIKEISGFNENYFSGIVWPENPKSIGYGAFKSSKSKINLIIPESVEKLSAESFYQSKIKHVVLPPNLTIIPSCCFDGCSELTDTLRIPDNVEIIENGAFANCKIQELILPAKLKNIGYAAFYGCYNLKYIHCNAIEPPKLDDKVFFGIEKDNFTLEVPEQSVDAYRNAPGWCEFKRISAYRNFVARPSKYNVLNKGGKKEIILNADSDWEMTECPSWCHIDKSSGSKKTALTLTVDPLSKGLSTREGCIAFKLKQYADYTTQISVVQYEYQYDEDQALTLQKATRGKGIDLVFIGDGYDAADISSGLYLEDMKQEMEYFFAVEPYSTYRDYFNVYTSFALSEDSGIETADQWRSIKFGTGIGKRESDRISTDWAAALDYCALTVPSTAVGSDAKVGCIMVANTDIYDGLTYSAGDSFCALVTKSKNNYPYDARGIVQHEAGGHGIGWLGDEYIYHQIHINNCNCICCRHAADLIADHSVGFALNLSLNGKFKEVPWTHLIFNPSYGDIVDVYEGGYFHSRGVYRSEVNSCMNKNIPYFSTWSRQLIVQRIMKLAGEEFSLDKFYANDSRSVGRDFTSTRRGDASCDGNIPVRHCNPPVRISNYKYGKKGGKK